MKKSFMKKEDVKRIKEAFAEAVKKHPNPDKPFTLPNGKEMTFRKWADRTANSPRFYKYVNWRIKSGKTTVDKVVDRIVNPPMPPKKKKHPKCTCECPKKK